MNSFNIYTFLAQLRQKRIHFELASYRENAIMILASVPGERWEIEFLENGQVEVEIFKSDGQIYDSNVFAELFTKFSD